MTDKAISPLRRRLIEDMTIRRLGPGTQHQYIRHVKSFADFVGRSPDKTTSESIHPFLRAARHHSRNISSRLGERMAYRSFLPLPCSTRMSIRSRSISVSLSDTTSEARRPVA